MSIYMSIYIYNIYIYIHIYIYIYIYAIMKTMCPLGYHHNGFVATHALGHNVYIYIYIYIFIYIYIYVYIYHMCIFVYDFVLWVSW